MPSSPNPDKLFREGVQAIRAGDRATGRAKLLEVVRRDELHEQAWLWLSAAAESDEERVICLENALTINPFSQAARRGLEKLGVEAPPLPPPREPPPAPAEPPPPPLAARAEPLDRGGTDHAAPDAVGPDLQALLVGERLLSRKRPDPPGDEAWRASLFDAAHTASEATLTPPIEPPRQTSLADLARVWGEVAIFKARGGLPDELRHGGVGHIAASLGMGGLLQVMAGLVWFFPLLLVGGVAAYVAPLAAGLEALAGVTVSPAGGGAAATLFTLLGGPDRVEVTLGALAASGGQLHGAAAGVDNVPALAFLIYTAFSILGTFAWQLCRGAITAGVARTLGGSGDMLTTTHALSIALVPGQIAQMPVALLAPFLPVTFLIGAMVILQLYRMVASAIVLRPTHRFGLLVALGVIIASTAILALAVGGLAALLWLPNR